MPTAQRLPLGQMIGAPFSGLQPPDPSRLENAAHARQLVLLERTNPELMQLIPDHSGSLRGILWLGLRVYDEHADLGRRVVIRAYRRRQFFLSHRAIQP